MCLTGNGVTFGLADGPGGTAPSTIGRVISTSGWGGDLAEIEDSDLLTSGFMEYCPGDLVEHEIITINVVTDPDVQLPLIITQRGKIFIGTLTFKLPAGQATPASLTGSGYIVGGVTGDTANNERMEGEIRFRFDNKSTPIAFTPSAAS